MKAGSISSYLSKRLEFGKPSKPQLNNENINPFNEISSMVNCIQRSQRNSSKTTFLSSIIKSPETYSKNYRSRPTYPSYALDGVKLLVDRLSMQLLKLFHSFKENAEVECLPTPKPETYQKPQPQLNKREEYYRKIFGEQEKQPISIKLQEVEGLIQQSEMKSFKRSRTPNLHYHKSTHAPSKSQVPSPCFSRTQSRNLYSLATSNMKRSERTLSNNYSKCARELACKSTSKPKTSVKARIEMAKQKLDNLKILKEPDLGIMSIVSNLEGQRIQSGETSTLQLPTVEDQRVPFSSITSQATNMLVCENYDERGVYSMAESATFSNDLQSPKGNNVISFPLATTGATNIAYIFEAACKRECMLNVVHTFYKMQKHCLLEARKAKIGTKLLGSTLKRMLLQRFSPILHFTKSEAVAKALVLRGVIKGNFHKRLRNALRTLQKHAQSLSKIRFNGIKKRISAHFWYFVALSRTKPLKAMAINKLLKNRRKKALRAAYYKMKDLMNMNKVKEKLLQEADTFLIQMHAIHLFSNLVYEKTRLTLRDVVNQIAIMGTEDGMNNINAQNSLEALTRIFTREKMRAAVKKWQRTKVRNPSALFKKLTSLIKVKK